MALRTEFTADGRGVFQTATGDLSLAELIVDLRQRQGDPARVAQRKFSLIDFSAVTTLQGATLEAMQRLIVEQRRLAQAAPKLDLAVVAPKDLIFGVARMWEGMKQDLGWEGCVVRTREEALAWLRERGHGDSLG